MIKAVKGPAPTNGFKKGRKKTGGRAPGSCGRETKLLKEAIMIAMELEGSDGCGTGKLIGFMRKVAREELSSFCGLAGRLIPVEVNATRDVKVQVTYRSVDEVRQELERRGVSIELVQKLMYQPPTIDGVVVDDAETDERTEEPADS